MPNPTMGQSARGSALILLLCGAAGVAVAAPPPPLAGTLVLDAASPFLIVRLAGRAIRLRVDPHGMRTIVLNPSVAAALDARWRGGDDVDVGRTRLEGRTAIVPAEIDGRDLPIAISDYGRVVTADADGLVGPETLPYAAVRWLRRDAPAATATRLLPLARGPAGLDTHPPDLPGGIVARVSLMQPLSTATGAAASLLAADGGAAFDGAAETVPLMFGVGRPLRPLRFARPPVVAGFRFDRLLVRIDDFRGRNPLPADPAAADEIVVARRVPPQHALAWVTIGADRLSRCAEIAYVAAPRALRLTCAFDR